MIKINDIVVDRFHADHTNEWSGEFKCNLNIRNVLKIEHYGKNYITDQNPDKYFELQKVFVNQVDLKNHIHKFKQTAYLPPWDSIEPPDHSLYLGHNGYLSLEFDSPVNSWIQKMFGLNSETMHGQATTVEVLTQVKNFFKID
jgi:hypothetical protein